MVVTTKPLVYVGLFRRARGFFPPFLADGFTQEKVVVASGDGYSGMLILARAADVAELRAPTALELRSPLAPNCVSRLCRECVGCRPWKCVSRVAELRKPRGLDTMTSGRLGFRSSPLELRRGCPVDLLEHSVSVGVQTA